MKKITFYQAAVILVFAIFSFSAVWYLIKGSQRRTFRFPVIGTETIACEVRYLPRNPAQGNLCLYVDELLLGPQTQRARPLFSAGTKNEFCFQRGKTLYVGLSQDVLYEVPEAARIKEGIALFRENIRRNFRGIKEIALFIDGKYVEEM